VPLDHHGVAKVSVGDEFRLQNNYDILPSVLLYFQNPVSREIQGGDVVLYERMLLAGVRFPFLDITRDLVLFLGICRSQIALNAWRYLFASFILWRSVLEARMTIPKFFNVYRVTYKREGVVEFTVRNNPIFIYPSPTYSNNRGWRSEFFSVSGDWESVVPLPDNQRMPREWRPIQADLREAPALNATGRRRVATMLTFSQTPGNAVKIDYDNIVTEENMWKVLKYQIPTGKVWCDQKGKTMVRKSGNEVAATPRAKASEVAPGPKRSTKPMIGSSKLKMVNKSATIPKGVVISEGRPVRVSTVAISSKVSELATELTEASEKEISTTSASATLAKVIEPGKESTEAFEEET